jgi:AraC-like DNA-binding protein
MRRLIETAMQRLVLSTDEVPEAQRFSYWREAVGEQLWGCSTELDRSQETPFHGRLVGSIGPSLSRFRSRSDTRRAFRGPRHIARRSWHDHILLYREFGAGAWFGWDRGELVTQPGDVSISDVTVPFVIKAPANCDFEVWMLPRKLLDPHLPASRRPSSFVLPAASRLTGIIKAYLDAVAGQIDALEDREVDLLADNFCRLLAVACGGAAGEHIEPLRLARLEEAKRYVRMHLADPELTPEKVAGALRISVRQLHRLFEPSGESFAQYVVSRRLVECRAALMNPIGDRSVSDVALAWGFTSLATFHRNFRQAFGAPPGELRRGRAEQA